MHVNVRINTSNIYSNHSLVIGTSKLENWFRESGELDIDKQVDGVQNRSPKYDTLWYIEYF